MTSEKQQWQAVPRERVFLQFISGLYGQSLVLLGEVEHPETKQKQEPSPEEARFLIDFLDVLIEKAKGNLTSQEDEFLQGIVADLKMRFVNLRGKAAP